MFCYPLHSSQSPIVFRMIAGITESRPSISFGLGITAGWVETCDSSELLSRSSPASPLCECVNLAPRAPTSHHLCSVRPRFQQGLAMSRGAVSAVHVLRVVCWSDKHHLPLPRAPRGGRLLQSSVVPILRVHATIPHWSALAERLSVDAIVLCVFHFGLQGRLPPKLGRCDSPQLRMATSLMVSGQFSTQTRLH